jgi:hypothetical protein
MWRRAVKFVAGFAGGIWLWSSAAPAYNRLLCIVAQPLLHIDRRFAAATLLTLERMVRVTSSTTLPVADIPADLLTYNVILLIALFALNDRALRWKNVRAFLISFVVIAIAHVAGLLIAIESTYAMRMGAWSEQHYSAFTIDFWLASELFYRIVGMFGLAFACWFVAPTRTAYRRMPQDRTG